MLQRQGDRGALWIALTYALLGILYISFSDQVVEMLVPNAERLTTLQTVKGIAFIVLTAVLVYAMVRGQNRILARAAERMQLSELRYEGIFTGSPIAIGFYGPDGALLEFNPAFRELFGIANLEAVRGFRLFDDPNLPADAAEALRRRVPARFECRYDFGALPRELGLARTDRLELDVMITPLAFENVRGFLSQIQDVTARRQLEEQLRQAQKMEAVGQLAGGVAHDFNNILTAIFGSVELLRTSLEKSTASPLVRESIDQVDRAGQRAAVLTRQLLTFSRGQITQPQLLNVNRVLAELRKMLERLIREDIQLEVFHAPDLWAIRADAGQLEQIVINLVVNARDAMPAGGKLTLETANVVLDEAYLTTHAQARPGPHVLLAVSDTGHGMDGATCQRIFEPFFTTKPVGAGTGLGLATVHGIVKQTGGHVEVYSEPNHGTTFKVYLPALPDTAAPEPSPHEPARLPRGQATILLCEDDAAVRHLATQTLAEHGYSVLPAARPHQALELARAHPGAVDLLITDVILPEMNGRQLANALLEFRPQVRVLYISGYTSNVIVRHGIVEAGIEFLQKPFRTTTLLQRVHEVLSAPPTPVAS